MKRLLVLFLISLALASQAATINFKDFVQVTNAANDGLLLLDVHGVGTNYTTRVISVGDLFNGRQQVQNFYVNNSVVTNLYTTNFYASYAYITNLFVTNISVQYITITSNLVANNFQGTDNYLTKFFGGGTSITNSIVQDIGTGIQVNGVGSSYFDSIVVSNLTVSYMPWVDASKKLVDSPIYKSFTGTAATDVDFYFGAVDGSALLKWGTGPNATLGPVSSYDMNWVSSRGTGSSFMRASNPNWPGAYTQIGQKASGDADIATTAQNMYFDLALTNVAALARASAQHTFTLTSPVNSHTTKIFVDSGGAGGLATDNITLGLYAGTHTLTIDPFNEALVPSTDGNPLSVGTSVNQFVNAYFSGTEYVSGFTDTIATNYSKLAIYHGGTNSSIVFDSQAGGTAGVPRPMQFTMGGTNLFQVGQAGANNAVFVLPGGVITETILAGLAYVQVPAVTSSPMSSQGYLVSNTHVATAGQQQYSPAFSYAGSGWSSNLAAPEAASFASYVVPTSGAAHPTANLVFEYKIGNTSDAFTSGTPFKINNQGPVQLASVTKAQKTAMQSPQNGWLVYQSDNTPGLRAYVNGAWVMVSTVADP